MTPHAHHMHTICTPYDTACASHAHYADTTHTPHAYHKHFTCTGITITNSELTTVVVNSELVIVMPVLYTVL